MDAYSRSVAARTIWGEARNQSPLGMQAVAHVILNRQKTLRWGKTVAAVCRAPWQFSCWNREDKGNRPYMEDMEDLDAKLVTCFQALNVAVTENAAGTDPTLGSLFYKVVGSPAAWAVGKLPCVTIGAHEFYNNVE